MFTYAKLPRHERICKWCSLSIADRVIESETHALFECKLYTHLRNSLIQKLQHTPELDDTFSIPAHIRNNNITLQDSLMKLLSSNAITTDIDTADPISHHHSTKLTVHSNSNDASHHPKNIIVDPSDSKSPNFPARSYVIRAVCSFIAKLTELRREFLSASACYGNTIPTYNPVL